MSSPWASPCYNFKLIGCTVVKTATPRKLEARYSWQLATLITTSPLECQWFIEASASSHFGRDYHFKLWGGWALDNEGWGRNLYETVCICIFGFDMHLMSMMTTFLLSASTENTTFHWESCSLQQGHDCCSDAIPNSSCIAGSGACIRSASVSMKSVIQHRRDLDGWWRRM
jgi:hypothetical protein